MNDNDDEDSDELFDNLSKNQKRDDYESNPISKAYIVQFIRNSTVKLPTILSEDWIQHTFKSIYKRRPKTASLTIS